MAKGGKKKVATIDITKLYANDELEYMDVHYVEAAQRLQYLDDKNYLATFYFNVSDVPS